MNIPQYAVWFMSLFNYHFPLRALRPLQLALLASMVLMDGVHTVQSRALPFRITPLLTRILQCANIHDARDVVRGSGTQRMFRDALAHSDGDGVNGGDFGG